MSIYNCSFVHEKIAKLLWRPTVCFPLFSLRLDVDQENLRSSITGKRLIETTSPLYFGGVRPGYAIVRENVGTQTHFIGCIGDVRVNGE